MKVRNTLCSNPGSYEIYFDYEDKVVKKHEFQWKDAQGRTKTIVIPKGPAWDLIYQADALRKQAQRLYKRAAWMLLEQTKQGD